MQKNRKQNRLAGFDYSQPGAYFITVCTKDRKCLLSTIVGGDAHIAPYAALTPTGAVVEKYLLTIPGIDRYVIMPNHVHMILRISAATPGAGPMWSDAPAEARVPSLIRSWKTLVSKELGFGIWQKSYYDHVIRDELDYITKAQYIDNNPTKWLEDKYYSIS